MVPGWWCFPSVQHKTPAKKNKSSDNRETLNSLSHRVSRWLWSFLYFLGRDWISFPIFKCWGWQQTCEVNLLSALVEPRGCSLSMFEHCGSLKSEHDRTWSVHVFCLIVTQHMFYFQLLEFAPSEPDSQKHVKAKVFGSAARRIAEGSSARRFAQFRRTYKTLTYSLILFDNLCILYHTWHSVLIYLL